MIDDGDFIDIVRSHHRIWDGSKGNSELKEKIWAVISDEVDKSVDGCKSLWQSLRSKYTREKRQLKQRGPNFKEKWSLFDKLSFLENVAKPRRNFKRQEFPQNDFDNYDDSSEITIDDESSRGSNQVPSNLSTNKPTVVSNIRIVSPKETDVDEEMTGEESNWSTNLQASEISRPITYSGAIQDPNEGLRGSQDMSYLDAYLEGINSSVEHYKSQSFISPAIMDIVKSVHGESSNIREMQSTSFAPEPTNMATNVTPDGTKESRFSEKNSFPQPAVSVNKSKPKATTNIARPLLTRVYFNKNGRKGVTPYNGSTVGGDAPINMNDDVNEITDGFENQNKRNTNANNQTNNNKINSVRKSMPCTSLSRSSMEFAVHPAISESRSVRECDNDDNDVVNESSATKSSVLKPTGTTSSTQKRVTKPHLTRVEWNNKVKKALRDPSPPSRATIEGALHNINSVVDELREVPDTSFDGFGKYIAGTLQKMTGPQAVYLENRILNDILHTRQKFNIENCNEGT